ncbi:MAG: hypothetical protein IJS63_01230 [Bacteroidaceae bacterium]|nr:hypothetical protein [Bacteroidaceae bacterium]
MGKQHFLIFMLLSVVCFSATAQEVVVEYVEGPTIMCQGDLRDIMYAVQTSDSPMKARQFAGSGDAFSYRERITNMPQYLHDFIDKFIEAGRTVLDGGSSWLSDPTKATSGSSGYYYPLKEMTDVAVPFTFPAGASSEAIKQAASDVFTSIYDEEYDVLKSFLPYAFLSLNYDHPEFFWIGNAYYYGISSGYRYSYYPTLGTGTIYYTINLTFPLRTNNFDIRTNGVDTYNFRNTTNLANGVQLFKSSKETILAECQTGSQYDKVLAAHEWLTHHNCYNYFYFPMGYTQSQIGDTPWSALSALEGNDGQQAPVCEGYARALKVLCDEMGIPCILMSGIVIDGEGNTGAHMWNYVQMEDKKWYAVDVTWDDPTVKGYYSQVVTGYESQKWFLLGSESPVEGGMTLIESHPEGWFNSYTSQGSYSWDLLTGPQLSPVAYTPGAIRTGDVNCDMNVDIADAVSVLNAMAGQQTSGNPDVNGDGNIDIADFVTVLNIMAGL